MLLTEGNIGVSWTISLCVITQVTS